MNILVKKNNIVDHFTERLGFFQPEKRWMENKKMNRILWIKVVKFDNETLRKKLAFGGGVIIS